VFDQVVAFGASTAKSRVSPGLMARRSCSRRTHKLHGEGGEGAATVSNRSHPPPRAASTGNPTHQSTCQRLLPKLTTTESDVSSRPALHPAVRSPHQSLEVSRPALHAPRCSGLTVAHNLLRALAPAVVEAIGGDELVGVGCRRPARIHARWSRRALKH
jgi:hypothetical protein